MIAGQVLLRILCGQETLAWLWAAENILFLKKCIMTQDVSLTKILGRNVTARREKLQLQQNELADRLTITQDTLSRIEHGKNFPKAMLIEKIAKELACSESELFCRPTEFTQVYAARISSLLKPLPQAKQEIIVDFVEFFSRYFLGRRA